MNYKLRWIEMCHFAEIPPVDLIWNVLLMRLQVKLYMIQIFSSVSELQICLTTLAMLFGAILCV